LSTITQIIDAFFVPKTNFIPLLEYPKSKMAIQSDCGTAQSAGLTELPWALDLRPMEVGNSAKRAAWGIKLPREQSA